MKADREIKVKCSACGHLTRIPTITNADRLRSMTDEELAEFLLRKEHHCPGGSTSNNCVEHETCEDCWLDWLKQEVTP